MQLQPIRRSATDSLAFVILLYNFLNFLVKSKIS